MSAEGPRAIRIRGARVHNLANVGRFSSDRTIGQYAEEIWGVEPVSVELGDDQYAAMVAPLSYAPNAEVAYVVLGNRSEARAKASPVRGVRGRLTSSAPRSLLSWIAADVDDAATARLERGRGGVVVQTPA